MAVRLHMNVGLVAEDRRLHDSADTTVVIEPVIGSTARTKGSLYLLVTGMSGRRLREATRIVADRIKDDYYYDLSAGISVCLRKAVNAANKMLLHSLEKPLGDTGDGPPIGLALAVVRGNELYVATLGPAEAYLIRQARLLTLPDASPESGMPAEVLDGPEVWHGEVVMGDCLVLVSPNVTRRIGLGPLQDAVGQLHPQAAVDQIQRQFSSGALGSTGGDGILVIEATEIAATHRAQPLRPVWPGDSLAGAPERSPIPLADTVSDGMAAVQGGARQVQAAADGWLRRGVYSLFDRMPERPVSRGRVTPMTVRRERQQRAAYAVIGLLSIIAIVGTGMWFFAGPNQQQQIDQVQTAQQAFEAARADVDAVYGNGKDLMTSDQNAAYSYLTDAYKKLQIAQGPAGYSPSDPTIRSLLAQTIKGLNEYYDVTIVQPQVVASFATDNLSGLVLGPDGAAYVLDSSVNTVYWVNLQTGTKLPVVWVGQEPTSPPGIVGNPRLMTTGGPDVLILDDINSVWDWRPAAGGQGRGIVKKVYIPDNANWGQGARAIGTFIVNDKQGTYNFYVALPSQNNIWKYTPAADGSGYMSASRTPYLVVPANLSNVDDMYIDGKLYLLQAGQITRYDSGQAAHGWAPDLPADTASKDKILRTHLPVYTRICSDNSAQDLGTLYAYDGYNRRVVAITKSTGAVVGDYMVPSDTPWFSNLTGLFVTTLPDNASPTLFWIEAGNLMSASLGPEGPSPTATGSLNPSGQPSGSLLPSPSS
jgi:hypothetical protein